VGAQHRGWGLRARAGAQTCELGCCECTQASIKEGVLWHLWQALSQLVGTGNAGRASVRGHLCKQGGIACVNTCERREG